MKGFVCKANFGIYKKYSIHVMIKTVVLVPMYQYYDVINMMIVIKSINVQIGVSSISNRLIIIY